MRMWMIDPEKMCNQHLLGEHVELHMLVGSMTKGKNLDGFIRDGLIMVDYVFDRHDEIVREMECRGMKHKSPLDFDINVIANYKSGNVDVDKSEKDIAARCDECAARISYVNAKAN